MYLKQKMSIPIKCKYHTMARELTKSNDQSAANPSLQGPAVSFLAMLVQGSLQYAAVQVVLEAFFARMAVKKVQSYGFQ